MNSERKSMKCPREDFYSFYKSVFYQQYPYYIEQFSLWAHRYAFDFNRIILEIDDTDWTDNVYTEEIFDGYFRISISRGFFERLIIFINLIIRTDRVEVSISDENQEDWKNPEWSVFDHVDHEDMFSDSSNLRPLFHNYKNNHAEYENDFNKHFSHLWNFDVSFSERSSIPVFWVIDFVVYHEMAHILLRHSSKTTDIISKRFNECTLGSREYYFRRHLAELHADLHTCSMICCSLTQFKKALNGGEIDADMKNDFFMLSFLVTSLFTIWSKNRYSHKIYENLPHPHPEIRKIFFMRGIARVLGNGNEESNYCSEWLEQYANAYYALQGSFLQLGAVGFADSLLNHWSTADDETLKLWKTNFGRRYQKYADGLIEFTQYLADFDLARKRSSRS